MNVELKQTLGTVGQIFARMSIMVLLCMSLVLSIGALNAADPAAAADVADIVNFVSVGRFGITIFDPFITAIIVWAIWPLGSLVTPILRRNEVSEK